VKIVDEDLVGLLVIWLSGVWSWGELFFSRANMKRDGDKDA